MTGIFHITVAYGFPLAVETSIAAGHSIVGGLISVKEVKMDNSNEKMFRNQSERRMTLALSYRV